MVQVNPGLGEEEGGKRRFCPWLFWSRFGHGDQSVMVVVKSLAEKVRRLGSAGLVLVDEPVGLVLG